MEMVAQRLATKKSRAIICMNKEAGQNPQIVSRRNKCRDDLREARMAKIYLTQWERVHTKTSSKIRRRARFGKLRSFHLIDGKPTGGTSTSGKDQDGHGMMKSEIFLSFVHM